MIKLIVAYDKNYLIGIDNRLPWYIPKDLNHFFSTVNNQTILLGEKTFNYLKLNNFKYVDIVVLTRNKDFFSKVVKKIYFSIDDVLKDYQNSNNDLYICGGEEIYKSFIPYIDEFIITKIYRKYEGNKYFPIELVDFKKYRLAKIKWLAWRVKVSYYQKK